MVTSGETGPVAETLNMASSLVSAGAEFVNEEAVRTRLRIELAKEALKLNSDDLRTVIAEVKELSAEKPLDGEADA